MRYSPDTSLVHSVLSEDELAALCERRRRRKLRPEAELVGALSNAATMFASRYPDRLTPERLDAFLAHNAEQEGADPERAISPDAFDRFSRIMVHYLSMMADYVPDTYAQQECEADQEVVSTGVNVDVADDAYAELRQAGLTGIGAVCSMLSIAVQRGLEDGVAREQMMRALIETMTMVFRHEP